MNDTDYLTRCRPQSTGTSDIHAELRAAGLVGPGDASFWTNPGNCLAPEREEREFIPEGESPHEIADREREKGMTVTQEEAAGWA